MKCIKSKRDTTLELWQLHSNSFLMISEKFPLKTYIFILNFSLLPLSEQASGAHVNEIKHDHSPVVIVV